jgi:hypothetical protein
LNEDEGGMNIIMEGPERIVYLSIWMGRTIPIRLMENLWKHCVLSSDGWVVQVWVRPAKHDSLLHIPVLFLL